MTTSSHIVVTVGRNIRDARDAKDWTQRKLAAELGVDIRAVSRWERGGIMPSTKNLMRLAELLDRDPSWFYAERERVA